MVSVIIPNYNHGKYLAKRIDSVLNQSYPNFEVIILDDCSTDNSRSIIEQYRSDPRISHIVYNTSNSGSTFQQWDKGISLSKGLYIWIAESDDFCEPSFLNELVPQFLNNDRIAIAFCQTQYVSPDNEILYKTSAGTLSQTIEGKKFLVTQMLGSNAIVNASMAIFRKSLVASLPQDYKQMSYCGDWLFWVNLCLLGEVFVSGKYLSYYLRHVDNVASNATRKGLDFLEGNKIFHFVGKKLKIGKADKENALKQRVYEYLRVRYSLADEHIGNEVWTSMLQLDPRIRSVLRKMIWKMRIRNYAGKLDKWLS